MKVVLPPRFIQVRRSLAGSDDLAGDELNRRRQRLKGALLGKGATLSALIPQFRQRGAARECTT